jgi:tetratricopeptide (TPR) repeat protein
MTDRVDQLRKRWEEEPSPQLSLQLAEEYRQLGQLDEGVVILEQALGLHPGHVAARVALGRFRLELGQLEEAQRVLEEVVDEDPTHLVANKLLVFLFLETGQRKQARDRLDLYKLLNASDPEIEFLEERLKAPQAVLATSEAAGERDELFAMAGSPTPLNLDNLAGAPTGTEALSHEPSLQGRTDDPFASLWHDVDTESHWQEIAAEGIFPVVEVEEKPEPPIVEEPAAATEPETVPTEEPVEDLFEESPGETAATVTLAKLYLDQGHLDEAEQGFREVLERQPEDDRAQEGLREIQRLREETLTSAPPLVEQTTETRTDLKGRKIRVLQEYLERLRSAARRH